MRILICAKNDLAANIACNRLCRGLGDAELSIWLSELTRSEELSDPDLATMRFFERDLPNRWIFPLLTAGPRRAEDAYLTFDELAERHHADLRIVPSLRADGIAPALATMDLVISIRFSHLFPADLIGLPRHGILNLHPGSLPRYAGLYAPMRQILDGQTQIGCTVHWIDAGIDTGPIIANGALPIDRERSLIWHVCHAYVPGLAPVLDIVQAVAGGRRPPGKAQDSRQRHYHRLPGAAEFQAFRDRGFTLVGFGDYEDLLEHYRARLPGHPDCVGSAARARRSA
jgi:hypothetical protein